MSFGCFLAYKTADRFFNQPEGGQHWFESSPGHDRLAKSFRSY